MVNLIKLPDEAKARVIDRTFEGENTIAEARYLMPNREYDETLVLNQGANIMISRDRHIDPSDLVGKIFRPLLGSFREDGFGHLVLLSQYPSKVPSSLDLGNGNRATLYAASASGNSFLGNPAEVDFIRGYVAGPEKNQNFFETMGFEFSEADAPGTVYISIPAGVSLSKSN